MGGSRLVWVVSAVALAVGVAMAGLTAPATARDDVPSDTIQVTAVPLDQPARPQHWVASWTASPGGTLRAVTAGHRTVRDVVRLSLGGTRLRIHLTNVFSGAALYVEHTTVGRPIRSGDPAVRRGTLRGVTFDGRRSVIIPARGAVVSDPVDLAVPGGGLLAVSVYTPFGSGPVTYHRRADQRSFLADGAAAGDLTGRRFHQMSTSWYYLAGVDVFSHTPRQSVVALGDSLTDGPGSGRQAHTSWPALLAPQLRPRGLAVVNAGIAGNRLLTDATSADAGPGALHRLDPDVLDQAGVTTLVLIEGINDIQLAPFRSARSLVAAIQAIVARAHARGVRVVCGTLPPYLGSPLWTRAGEATRMAVNARLRAGGLCDNVADTDAALRDPRDPQRLKAGMDAGDHLHPDDAGLRAIARVVAGALR